jgi:hypothetical protein
MGNQDMAEIQAGRMDPEGEGTTQAGRICGMIGTIFLILSIVGCVFYVIFIAAMVGATAHAREALPNRPRHRRCSARRASRAVPLPPPLAGA